MYKQTCTGATSPPVHVSPGIDRSVTKQVGPYPWIWDRYIERYFGAGSSCCSLQDPRPLSKPTFTSPPPSRPDWLADAFAKTSFREFFSPRMRIGFHPCRIGLKRSRSATMLDTDFLIMQDQPDASQLARGRGIGVLLVTSCKHQQIYGAAILHINLLAHQLHSKYLETFTVRD